MTPVEGTCQLDGAAATRPRMAVEAARIELIATILKFLIGEINLENLLS